VRTGVFGFLSNLAGFTSFKRATLGAGRPVEALRLVVRVACADRVLAMVSAIIRTRRVTNLAGKAPWRRRRYHSHPCRPVARPRFRCRSRGHPPRLGASTDLRHIAPVAISPTAGRSRPLSFVSVILLARPFSCPLRLLSPID